MVLYKFLLLLQGEGEREFFWFTCYPSTLNLDTVCFAMVSFELSGHAHRKMSDLFPFVYYTISFTLRALYTLRVWQG